MKKIIIIIELMNGRMRRERIFTFSFDRVFYHGFEQVDVYEFLAHPFFFFLIGKKSSW